MSQASQHDRAVLLRQDIAECAGVGAHYLRMTADYAFLGNDAGTRFALKCAIEHLKAAARSFKDLEELKVPKGHEVEAAQ